MSAERYFDAIDDLVRAHNHLATLIATVADVAARLKDWDKTHPQTLNGTLEKAIEAWPDANSLSAAIAAWKAASAAVMRAWEAVPKDRRAALKSPDEFKL
jgi:hypothetical protein